ncbi:YwqG family protein [Kitasatospora sp. NBC_01287]|nr:YwqG family protein [Kitasatospora sp. NBC_01287]
MSPPFAMMPGMVRTLRIKGFSETGRPISTPTTKFGGQPGWLAGPQWPISAAWGRPMRFVGQIELGPVIGAAGQGRMAYVFVTHADHEEDFFDPDIVDPDGGENAVIVQPGGHYAGPVRPLATGPGLYGVDGSEVEYTVDLRAADEPGSVTDEELEGLPSTDRSRYVELTDGDQIGGTPLFFQGDEWPDGGPWRLLLQLDSNWLPFHLDLGAAPRLFAFVSEDGTEGRLLVQDS